MVSFTEALRSKTRILESLTPEDFDIIQDTLNKFEARYMEEVVTNDDHVDEELYGFRIDHLTPKQRLYLKHNGYKVICRWDRTSGTMICTLNFM